MISKSCTRTTTTRTIISRSRARFSFSSTSSSSSSSSSPYKLEQQQEQERQQWIRRCRLLDASRGLLLPDNNDDNDADSPPSTIARTKKRPLPAFPLEARHFGGFNQQHILNNNSDNTNTNNNDNNMKSFPPNTPKEFHHYLCDMIRNAKERVYIASLYIGPATSDSKDKDDDDDCEETELLNALSEISNKDNNCSDNDNDNGSNNNNKVTVKIILDENRALRPVPVKKKSSNISSSSSGRGSDNNNNNNKNPITTTTSSAEAVAHALYRWRGGNSNSDSNSSPSSSQQTSDSDSSSLYLFRVLPSTMISLNSNDFNWLPNPLNEIAGVFHIKIYIVDDQLLLSGANLSSEYFRDRMDRYLHIVQGGNGLVQFYTKLIDILCSHSNEYKYGDDDENSSNECSNENENRNVDDRPSNRKNRRDEFLREITEHFQDPNHPSGAVTSAHDLFTGGKGAYDNNNGGDDDDDDDEKKIVAVGIPTFQAPVGFFRNQYHADDDDDDNNKINKTTIAATKPVSIIREVVSAWSTFWSLIRINKQPKDRVEFITDVEATLNLLREAGNLNNNNNNSHYSIQLSSAYLNPTSKLLSILRIGFKKIELLTAGTISHGFRPKNKDCNQGSQGTDWTIPSIFQKLVDDCMVSLRQQQQQPQSSSNTNTNTNTKNSIMDARLYHWERPQWTFHAKGIWLREEDEKKKKYAIDTTNEKEYNNDSDATATRSTTVTSIISDNGDTSEVAAVVVGSSNFGYRSFCRDMESNLILVFPPSSSNSTKNNNNNNNNDNDYDNGIIARSFGQEWNNLLASSKRESEMMSTPKMESKQQQQQQGKNEVVAAITAEKLPPLSWPILFTIPYIKTFF